jgi:hypothetical protein
MENMPVRFSMPQKDFFNVNIGFGTHNFRVRAQYDREQELYTNKALLSKESKERLELNFMYEPPPGMNKFS